MAYEVRYAPSFERQLHVALDQLAEGDAGEHAVERMMSRIREIKQVLETFPESFPYVDDGYLRLREYRKAVAGKHLLLYRISEYRAIIKDGELVEHGEVGGFEGVVLVTHLFRSSSDWEGLL